MQIEGTFYKVVIHYEKIDKTVYADWMGANRKVAYTDSAPDVGDFDSWNHYWFTHAEVYSHVLPMVKQDHPAASIVLEVTNIEVYDSPAIVIQ